MTMDEHVGLASPVLGLHVSSPFLAGQAARLFPSVAGENGPLAELNERESIYGSSPEHRAPSGKRRRRSRLKAVLLHHQPIQPSNSRRKTYA
jgi:hypothetical protein